MNTVVLPDEERDFKTPIRFFHVFLVNIVFLKIYIFFYKKDNFLFLWPGKKTNEHWDCVIVALIKNRFFFIRFPHDDIPVCQ